MNTTVVIVIITALSILAVITIDVLKNVSLPKINILGRRKGYNKKDRDENEEIRARIVERSNERKKIADQVYQQCTLSLTKK